MAEFVVGTPVRSKQGLFRCGQRAVIIDLGEKKISCCVEFEDKKQYAFLVSEIEHFNTPYTESPYIRHDLCVNKLHETVAKYRLETGQYVPQYVIKTITAQIYSGSVKYAQILPELIICHQKIYQELWIKPIKVGDSVYVLNESGRGYKGKVQAVAWDGVTYDVNRDGIGYSQRVRRSKLILEELYDAYDLQYMHILARDKWVYVTIWGKCIHLFEGCSGSRYRVDMVSSQDLFRVKCMDLCSRCRCKAGIQIVPN